MWLGMYSCSVSSYSSYVSRRTYLHGMLLKQHMKVEGHLVIMVVVTAVLVTSLPAMESLWLSNYIEKFLIIIFHTLML